MVFQLKKSEKIRDSCNNLDFLLSLIRKKRVLHEIWYEKFCGTVLYAKMGQLSIKMGHLIFEFCSLAA